MRTVWLAAAMAGTALAAPAFADEFRFDFTGTVLAQTRPGPPSVTPQPITGSLTYTAPASGNISTLNGTANLTTSLYGNFSFTRFTTTLTSSRFTFSSLEPPTSQGFSLSVSALPGGGYGFLVPGDGFSLTGDPVNASGRLSGRFANGTTPVPEPAGWLLMIGGVGLLGGALRYRRTPSVRFVGVPSRG